MTEVPAYPLIINGERCEPASGAYDDVINPATGEVIGRAAMGSAADVDIAVKAARAAFDNREWREMSPDARSKVLYACAHTVMRNAPELIELEIGCSGATLNRASNLDIPAVADLWMNLAEAVKSYPFVTNQSPRPPPEQWHSQVFKEPVGVCGLNPGIVLPDADLDMVAQGSLWAVYMNAGQACESGTRLLVHEDVYEELLQKLAERSAQVIVGNPADPATGVGPMSTETHFHRVLDYIESGINDGARVVCGGKPATVEGCGGGFYIEPTVLADVTNDMKVAREEIFGPVLAVIKYSDVEEAIRIANDTEYGLSAGIWTGDLVRAQQLARELRAGSVWVNDWHMMRTDAPFGGYKQSGYGRELGAWSIDAYVETKAVQMSFERMPERKAMQRIVHTTMGQ